MEVKELSERTVRAEVFRHDKSLLSDKVGNGNTPSVCAVPEKPKDLRR